MKAADAGSATTRRQFISQLGALGLTSVAMPLVGASPQTAYAAASGTLRVAYGAIGPDRHPQKTSIIPDDDIINLIFDPLLRLSGQPGKFEAVLAAQYRQVNDTRWRFSLRPGVKFHDGSPLTSTDVKFTMEHFAKAPEVSNFLYKWLDRVEIVDDTTVDVVTGQPNRSALIYMAYYSHIIPRTATNVKEFSRHPVGTGPYRFVEFAPNTRVVVEANRNYWGPGKPHFERIVFRQIPENGTRVAALETREVDFADNVPIEDVRRLQSAGFQVVTVPSNRCMFAWFNIGAEGPWRDPRVRQALTYAIDRDAIRGALMGGLGANMEAPIARNTAYFNKGLRRYEYDPAKARQLLAAAGYPNGFGARIATPSGRYLKDREIAEAIAGQLEQVGVRLSLVPLEWATFVQQVRSEARRQYGLILAAWGNVPGDPFFGLRPFETGDIWNVGGYANEELRSLLEQGKVTFDDVKLQTIYGRAQEIIWQDAPCLFLFELPIVRAFSPKLKRYVPRSDELINWNVVTRAG